MISRRFTISVDSCRPGMRTAETITNKYGAVILYENVTLDERAIERLKNMGIQYISVFEDSMLSVSGMDREWAITDDGFSFNVKYEQDVHTIKMIFADISAGKRLDKDITDQVVDSMVIMPQQNRHVVDAVMQTRRIDEYTYYHCVNVAMLSMMIARWMNLDESMVRKCTEAGLLHDVGKARVPVEIINKPGKLTESEFEEMKRHSEYGYMIAMQDRRIDPDVAPFKVFEIMQHSSFGVLNPLVLNSFLNKMTHYYVGSRVRLSTGETAEVVFMNRMDFSKPVVRVEDRFIDLAVAKKVSIEEFL